MACHIPGALLPLPTGAAESLSLGHFPDLRNLTPPSSLSLLSKSLHRVHPKQETGLEMNTVLIEPNCPQPVPAQRSIHTGLQPDFQRDAADTGVPTQSSEPTVPLSSQCQTLPLTHGCMSQFSYLVHKVAVSSSASPR